MSSLIDFLLWVPVITLLAYTPLVCYLDWKYREVTHDWWLGLVTSNVPVWLLLIALGAYEWWAIVISLVATAIWFILMRMHFIEGADFMYLMWISLFFIYNPVSGHWLMALSMMIFFMAWLGVFGLFLVMYNITHGRGISFEMEGHVPMMLPISLALITTVVLA